ncbi:MAG: hypothetical protein Q9170_001421 [Blastenia crenularia]
MPPPLFAYVSDHSDILSGERSSTTASSRESTPATSAGPAPAYLPHPGNPRKRKRAGYAESLACAASLFPEFETNADLVNADLIEPTEKRLASPGFIGVHPPYLVYPKSLYAGHQPPLPRTEELAVLKEVVEAEADSSDASSDDFISIDLEDFSIYRPHKSYSRTPGKILESGLLEGPRANELVSLHELNGRVSDCFILDGTLAFDKNGVQRRYVQQIAFETLSIGGYEENSHTVGPDIWLQSVAGNASNVWYRLRRPSQEYLRYHEPFLWLADLAKHVVDYLHTHDKVKIQHFRAAFATWLQSIHAPDQNFLLWRSKYPQRDFRHAIIAQAPFLYNQAGQLGFQYIRHPLWDEVDPNALTAVPRQPKERADRRTVVTVYTFECFKHLPWAKFLEPVSSATEEQAASEGSWRRPCPATTPAQGHQARLTPSRHAYITSSQGEIRTGDIVAIRSDANTKWKTEDKYWYAYVQGRTLTSQGHQLELIWVYRPTDTACQEMKYPYTNELFLSDHCNCGDEPVYTADVVRKVGVSLYSYTEVTDAVEFFIRQTYNSSDSYWASLKPQDLQCQCRNGIPTKSEYVIGDTLLLRTSSRHETLEPVILVDVAPDGDHEKIRVRKLLRKRKDFGDLNAEPNELVYTTRFDLCDKTSIARRCSVRFYTPDDQELGRIPAPYNRKGAGDCYYILWKQDDAKDLNDIQMNQGFDPENATTGEPMRGLDIFCGGGSLGRGLEEGGAVRMDWAVDYFNEAMHTYHANNKDSTKLYNGSVNDYLYAAIKERWANSIAKPGEVAVISAGSPCQGFSLANRLYANDASLLNISLVASVVAFVDFYRPKYVLMENVVAMASCGPKRAGQNNVFAQILCALVGLGYQVRPMLLDSWNFGAPQGRSRLFITAAAPGLKPFTQPPPSHSHPDGVVGRWLGKAANGLPFGVREWVPTPFEYVSIGEATKDLPENPDGRTTCIECPDHRVTRNFSVVDYIRLSCIPRFPPGMTFVKSAKLGWQSATQMAAWHWDTDVRSNIHSKAWQRAKSNALLPTVMTRNAPNDAINGSALHWDAHRPLTVMEVRRAQGYPDDEVIVGTPAMQWKIVGNSVTRQVAIALGMSLREAWLGDGPSSTASDLRCFQ